jgi:hypothetical protein
MRTTLDLDGGLLREAKRTAAERGTTLSRILEQALRGFLLGAPRPRGRFRFHPVIVRGRSNPAVNVADRRALYDRMDGRS